jgi:hypothetical protein
MTCVIMIMSGGWRLRAQALVTTVDEISPVKFQPCEVSKVTQPLKLGKDIPMEWAKPGSEVSSTTISEANDSLGKCSPPSIV